LKDILIQQVGCGFSLSEMFTPLIKVERMQKFLEQMVAAFR
jgi:hypothetical protein